MNMVFDEPVRIARAYEVRYDGILGVPGPGPVRAGRTGAMMNIGISTFCLPRRALPPIPTSLCQRRWRCSAPSSAWNPLYLISTDAGLPYIEGVGARYFLPLLPFFIFLLPLLARLPGVSRLRRLGQFWFCLPAAAMAAANIYALPAYIYHIFRMPGP